MKRYARLLRNGKNMNRRKFIKTGAFLPGGFIAAALPSTLSRDVEIAENTPLPPGHTYPPARTGLRGAHPGAFEAAHALVWKGPIQSQELSGPVEDYDLIIIGAGVSGLASAYFYRQLINKNARILLLDNHDDFGGHGTRNEFTIDGRAYITYGGDQSIVNPSKYSSETTALMNDLGIDFKTFEQDYNSDFFSANSLSAGIFFDQETFGKNVLVQSGFPNSKKETIKYALHHMPGLVPPPFFQDVINQTPLTDRQITKIKEIIAVSPTAEKYFLDDEARYYEATYLQFLEDVYAVNDPAVFKLLSMLMAYDSALGGYMVTVPAAVESNMLGLPPVSFFEKHFECEIFPDEDPFVHHFPDGCATIPRLLVKKLIPDIANFNSPQESINAIFDYRKLDNSGQPVRIRLNSTAVYLDNSGAETVVRYVQQGAYLNRGKLYEARARHTIMAGWHIMAARMIPSLPETQKDALKANIKLPLIWAQVILKNWNAVKKSGVAISYCPGAYFQSIQCDFPVRYGNHQPGTAPVEPLAFLMVRMPCPLLLNKSIPKLVKQGLAEMLATSLETYELKIREQLLAMYGAFGFDPQKDIAAITVNRWPHGYLWSDAEYQGEPAYLTAAKRHGNIVFANADSAGKAYLDNAIDMAWKAVNELKA